jgi:predicted  nucleic acid-binding Zn-ribbon protein
MKMLGGLSILSSLGNRPVISSHRWETFMARNKPRRPGVPPSSDRASEGSPAGAEAAEGGAEASGLQPGAAAESAGPTAWPAEERLTGTAGMEPERTTDSLGLDDAASATDTGQWPSGGAPLGEAKPPDPAPRSAAAAPRSYRSWLAGLGGGVIGGGAVALLAHLVPQQAPELAEVRGQLDQLRQSVSQIEQPVSEELPARLQALEAAAAGEQDLPERLQAIEGMGSSLGARVASLEKQLATIETGAPGAVAPERVATLEKDVADLGATLARLRESVPSAGAAGDQAGADLASRIDALERRLGQAQGAGAEVEGLAGRLGAVEQQIAAGRQEATGLTDDVASLSGRVEALSNRADELGEGLDHLKQQIASTDDRRTQAATLARAVAQLDGAIDQGEPFADLLEGLRGQGDPVVAQAVEDLQPAAASGVPSLAALRSSFDAVANPIVHAAQVPEGDGLLEKAAGNLMSLVTVRPVGADVEGDSAAARVARAEAALDGGDLAAAVAELEALDGAAAAAAAPWFAEARPRLAAEAALHTLQERATLLLTERP